MIETLDTLVEQLLQSRGLTTATQREQFLNPQYTDLSGPFTMHDMKRAVNRLIVAIDTNERIAVYADYDADGIPGAVVIADTLRKIGCTNFQVIIPHRIDDGYGIHTNLIDAAVTDGVTIMITVDVGITAVDAVEYAQSRGLDVIITDHHEPVVVATQHPNKLATSRLADSPSPGSAQTSAHLEFPTCSDVVIPSGYAVVHPKLGTYADPMICGCAVAFQFMRGLLIELRHRDHRCVREIPDGWEKWLLDLVGLSTIADQVPLLGENRILAKYGLDVMHKTRRPGLVMLLKSARVEQSTVTEDELAFRVIPRINAASRMAHPEVAFRLLFSESIAEATELAAQLARLNDERKKQVDRSTREAMYQVSVLGDSLPVVLGVYADHWNIGVIGIIASRVAEQFNRPVFVWSLHESGVYKGSARSWGGIDVLNILRNTPENILSHYGGHLEAGGFTVNVGYQEKFREYIHTIQMDVTEKPESNTVSVDGELALSMVHMGTVNAVRALAPFGAKNPAPIFRFPELTIVDWIRFGKDSQYCRLVVTDRFGGRSEVIVFDSSMVQVVLSAHQITVIGSLDTTGTGSYMHACIRPQSIEVLD